MREKMSKRVIAAGALMVLLQLAATKAHADFLGSPPNCADALKQDIVVHLASETQQYAYLSIIDEHQFDEMKTGGSVSATIPVVDALVKASASFEDFRQQRTDFLNKVGYSSNSAQAENDLSITTSPLAYAAFTTCMATLAHNQIGFHAWKESENQDAVVISYYYQSPPGGGPIGLSGSLIHGEVPGVAQGQIFPPRSTVLPDAGGTVTIQREGSPGATVTATLVGAGYPGTTIESTYRQAPPVVTGTGFVRVSVTNSLDADAGDVSKPSAQTNNNNNRRCSHQPCSDDGKWQADAVDIRIPAPPGVTLSNPRCTCTAGGSGCVYWHQDALAIDPDGSAHCAGRTWSSPTVWTLTAHQTKKVAQTTTVNADPVSFHAGGLASFLVPENANNPVIVVTYKGSTFPIQPGSNAPDGSLTFVAKVPSGASAYYVYKVP